MLTNRRSRPSRVVTNRTWCSTPITLLTNPVRTATISANGIVVVFSQLRTTNAEPVNVNEKAYNERMTSRNDTIPNNAKVRPGTRVVRGQTG